MKILRILLFSVLALLFSSPSWAAIVKVQDQAIVALTSASPQSVSVTLPGVALGNTILVALHTGCATFTLTDNNGGVYTQAPNTGIVGILMATNHPAGSTTVTATITTGGCFLGIMAAEFSGLGIAPTFDSGAVTGYGTATTIQTGTISTSAANPELVFGFGFTDSVQTPSALIDYGTGGGSPSALANQAQTAGGTGETMVGAFQVVSTAGPFGFQWTVTSSNTQGGIASILPGNPSITASSICPAGANGPCLFPATTVLGLAQQKCPAGITCQSVITDANAACAYNTAPVGGGVFRCEVLYDQNQGKYIED